MFLALSNTVDAFCVKCWNVVFLNCRRSYVYVFTRLNDWLLGKVNLTLVQFYLWQLQIYQNSCRWHRDENMSGNSDCQEKNKIYVGSKLFDVQRATNDLLHLSSCYPEMSFFYMLTLWQKRCISLRVVRVIEKTCNLSGNICLNLFTT
jgi:hypothetical protein